MKNILYNVRANDFDKWKMYRENLIRYRNVKKNAFLKQKTISPESGEIIFLPKNEVSISNYKKPTKFTVGTQTVKQTDVYTHPNKTLEDIDILLDNDDDDDDDGNHKAGASWRTKPSKTKSMQFSSATSMSESSGRDSSVMYDRDNTMREMALEDTPKDPKILSEGFSTNPNEYRVLGLSTGDVVTVSLPEDKPDKRITRSILKRQRGTSQMQLNLSKRKIKIK